MINYKYVRKEVIFIEPYLFWPDYHCDPYKG